MKIIKLTEDNRYWAPVRAFVWFETFDTMDSVDIKVLLNDALKDLMVVKEILVKDFEPDLPLADYEIMIKGKIEVTEESLANKKVEIRNILENTIENSFVDVHEVKTDVKLF